MSIYLFARNFCWTLKGITTFHVKTNWRLLLVFPFVTFVTPKMLECLLC